MYRITNAAAFDRLMLSAHWLEIRVEITDLLGRNAVDVSKRFVDGAVSVDSEAETTRALDITLFDPGREISLDLDRPTATSVFISNMVRVTYIIMNPQRTVRYACPVFCGPIDDVDRDDLFIVIKALGKEKLGLNNSWLGRTYKKGQLKSTVIRRILVEELGDQAVSIVTSKEKLPNDVKLTREKSPWIVAKKLASSMGMFLFYDAAGVPTLRKRSSSVALRFGDNNLTAQPKIAYDLSNVVNTVLVVGKKPKKGKAKVQYKLVAPRNHPLSPENLGRPGAPRYLWSVVEDESLRTNAACRKVARSILGRGLLAGVEVEFEGVPNPRLQEGDVVSIRTDKLSAQFPIRKFTIPLSAGANSSYGYLRRARVQGRAKSWSKKAPNNSKGGKREWRKSRALS